MNMKRLLSVLRGFDDNGFEIACRSMNPELVSALREVRKTSLEELYIGAISLNSYDILRLAAERAGVDENIWMDCDAGEFARHFLTSWSPSEIEGIQMRIADLMFDDHLCERIDEASCDAFSDTLEDMGGRVEAAILSAIQSATPSRSGYTEKMLVDEVDFFKNRIAHALKLHDDFEESVRNFEQYKGDPDVMMFRREIESTLESDRNQALKTMGAVAGEIWDFMIYGSENGSAAATRWLDERSDISSPRDGEERSWFECLVSLTEKTMAEMLDEISPSTRGR